MKKALFILLILLAFNITPSKAAIYESAEMSLVDKASRERKKRSRKFKKERKKAQKRFNKTCPAFRGYPKRKR